MTTDDAELVQIFARSGSEEAFAALVARHVNLVYSVALRQVRDPHQAEEITQTVFLVLARKAGSLGPHTVVSAWLCRTARNVSARALTMQRRRQARELEAFMQSPLSDPPPSGTADDDWKQIEPLLDDAMSRLSEADHNAVVLRFLEGRSFREVSVATGVSEAAAKMRVNRALGKLRTLLARRGLALPAAAIGAAVSAHSVHAAPAGLAAATTLAVAGSAAAASPLSPLLHLTLKSMRSQRGLIYIIDSLGAVYGSNQILIVHYRPEASSILGAPPSRQEHAKLRQPRTPPSIRKNTNGSGRLPESWNLPGHTQLSADVLAPVFDIVERAQPGVFRSPLDHHKVLGVRVDTPAPLEGPAEHPRRRAGLERRLGFTGHHEEVLSFAVEQFPSIGRPVRLPSAVG